MGGYKDLFGPKQKECIQCVKLQTHLPKILGGNTIFVVGSCETLMTRLSTSLLLPYCLPFDLVAQLHVSLGCYPEMTHHPVHLIGYGHSWWFCFLCKGCVWSLDLCNAPLLVTPHCPQQHAITKEAGPQLQAGLWGGHLFATAKMGRFLLFSYKNIVFFSAVALKICLIHSDWCKHVSRSHF